MPAFDTDALAERIYLGFLKPASEIPSNLWRDQWKLVNRAAGVIAGAAVALCAAEEEFLLAPDGEEDTNRNRRTAEAIAQEIADGVCRRMEPSQLNSTLAKGLGERTVKCLFALTVAEAPHG